MIRGEETSVRSPRKHSSGHLRAVKQLITVALDLEEVRELILRPLSLFNCIYVQDISCKQANECELLNRKMIGTLVQMAITHLNNSYTHKVKRT